MVEVLGPIIMAVLVALVDFFFMIKDMSGTAKDTVNHTISSFVGIIIMVFIAFNIEFVRGLSFMPEVIQNEYVIIALVGLIAAIFVHAKSAVFKKARGAGTHITWVHSLIIGFAIALSPYIWQLIAPTVKEYLPQRIAEQ